MEGAVSNLFRIVQYCPKMRAGGKIETQQMTNEVRRLQGFFSTGRRETPLRQQQSTQPLLQFLAGHGGTITVLDVKAESKHVPNQGIRQPAHAFSGPAIKNEPLVPLRLQPGVKLVKQARLADAGIADDGHDLELAVFQHAAQEVLQTVELGFAPNHARLDSLHALALK